MADESGQPEGADVERLRSAVEKVKPRSKMARLRQIMPELERKEREGACAADLVAALAEAGLEMSVGTFWKYRSRWRAEARRPAQTRDMAEAGSSQPHDTVEPALSPSANLIVDEQAQPDYERTRAMLDPKKREEFAAQFIERPLERWLRKKGSIEE